MKPNEWIKQANQIIAMQDWDALAKLRKHTNEYFARSFDFVGLQNFYITVMKERLSKERAFPLIAANSEAFQSTIRRALDHVKHQIATKPELKGVYFEYYFDGHKDDSNTGNFFLCNRYSDTEDGWGAEFDDAGFIEGAQLPDYFFFDADWEWDEESRFIAEEAANGRLLAAVLEEWKDGGITGIPLGFANHDHDMVRAVA